MFTTSSDPPKPKPLGAKPGNPSVYALTSKPNPKPNPSPSSSKPFTSKYCLHYGRDPNKGSFAEGIKF